MTRLFLIAEQYPAHCYNACAFARLIQPLSHPLIREEFDIQSGPDLPDQSFDVVITERFWSSDKTIGDVQDLVRRIKRQAGWFIYELDDNLIDLPAGEPWLVTEEQKAMVRLFLSEADAATVSTLLLAERVRDLCKRVFIVPNAIDETLFPPAEKVQEKLGARSASKVVTFGYMGTRTHTLDLMMIIEPLRRVLQMRADRVEFQIAEATDDPSVRSALDGLPHKFLNVGNSTQYPAFVRWEAENMNWDFGIAPLTDCPLNHSKSDMKFLEYGVLGIPGIYTAGPTYSPSVEHLRTGIVCDNDAQSWYQALTLMIDDGELRRKLAANALGYVHSQRTITKSIGHWQAALRSASGVEPKESRACRS